MGLYAGADYNHTLCPLQSRLQYIYYGQPYARADRPRVDFIPLSETLDLAFANTGTIPSPHLDSSLCRGREFYLCS
jgi:hypothetical protein